jgi:hypothetical protein
MLSQEQIKDHIAHRENEVSSYESNYNNYKLQIEAMGEIELPEELKKYIGKKNEELPLSLSIEECELISDYNHLQRLKMLERTEFLEMKKSKLTLDVLKSQINN